MKKNAYAEAAKKALLKQNKMTEEKIDNLIKKADNYMEIEKEAHIEKYMWAAMSKILDLTHANGTALIQFAGQILVSDYAYEDEISYDDINRLWKSEVKDNNSAVLDILSAMHNDLIKKISSIEITRKTEKQDIPFELLGWEKVEEYLSYLSPILDRIGVSFDENQLKQEYEKLSPKFNNEQRLYGKYEPISKKTQKVIDDLYEK